VSIENSATKTPSHQGFFYNKPLGEPLCLCAFVAIFIAGKITLSPFINYTFIFLEAINQDDEFWFGISLIF
jgi:hypothetical protein